MTCLEPGTHPGICVLTTCRQIVFKRDRVRKGGLARKGTPEGGMPFAIHLRVLPTAPENVLHAGKGKQMRRIRLLPPHGGGGMRVGVEHHVAQRVEPRPRLAFGSETAQTP